MPCPPFCSNMQSNLRLIVGSALKNCDFDKPKDTFFFKRGTFSKWIIQKLKGNELWKKKSDLHESKKWVKIPLKGERSVPAFDFNESWCACRRFIAILPQSVRNQHNNSAQAAEMINLDHLKFKSKLLCQVPLFFFAGFKCQHATSALILASGEYRLVNFQSACKHLSIHQSIYLSIRLSIYLFCQTCFPIIPPPLFPPGNSAGWSAIWPNASGATLKQNKLPLSSHGSRCLESSQCVTTLNCDVCPYMYTRVRPLSPTSSSSSSPSSVDGVCCVLRGQTQPHVDCLALLTTHTHTHTWRVCTERRNRGTARTRSDPLRLYQVWFTWAAFQLRSFVVKRKRRLTLNLRLPLLLPLPSMSAHNAPLWKCARPFGLGLSTAFS